MTEVSLPYDQVCEIIESEAVASARPDWVTEPWTPLQVAMVKLFRQHGHYLWRALEEAHLAKLDQTGERG